MQCYLWEQKFELQRTDAPPSKQRRNRIIQSPKPSGLNRRNGNSKTHHPTVHHPRLLLDRKTQSRLPRRQAGAFKRQTNSERRRNRQPLGTPRMGRASDSLRPTPNPKGATGNNGDYQTVSEVRRRRPRVMILLEDWAQPHGQQARKKYTCWKA